MSVSDPYTELSDVLEEVVTEEFSPDHPYLDVRHDRLHESLGTDGRTYVGLFPSPSNFTNGVIRNVGIVVQFYDAFEARIDPQQQVDPRRITAKSTRLLNALRDRRTVGTSSTWFFNVEGIDYPKDATGNMTRFEMTITSMGQNTGLLETTG